MEIRTKSAKETQKVAAMFAAEVAYSGLDGPVVLALEGNLGAGKTTFTQGFLRAFGVEEKVLSPTFVLMKIYNIPKKRKKSQFKHLIHMDCYRLASEKELRHLDFKKILHDKDAVVIIEWADKIKKMLPKNAAHLQFIYGRKSYERIIRVISESR